SGRGGSTAGSGGSTARGGSGGGTAGVTGGGGMGGCTITATSTMGTIPTVGIVTFTTTATSPTAAEIRFGPSANSLTLLLGMKGSTNYVYRILVTSSAGTCTSQDYTFMTGAVPSSVPKPTVTISNASAHAKGFIVTSSGLSGTGAYIYDSNGEPVWWATGPTGVSRIQM